MADHPQRTILWKLDLHYTIVGVACQNGFYFWNLNVISDDTLSTWTALLADSFQSRILPLFIIFQNQKVTNYVIKVTTLIPDPGPFAELQVANTTGAQVNDCLPSHDAAVITLLTPLNGRSHRGRLYIGGVDEELTDTNTLVPSYFDQLRDIGQGLTTHYGNGGADQNYRYAVYSRKLGTLIPGIQTFSGVFDIFQTVPRKFIATQRHRKQGHGP